MGNVSGTEKTKMNSITNYLISLHENKKSDHTPTKEWTRKMLANPEAFRRFLWDNHSIFEFRIITKKFPKHTAALIEKILSYSDREFRALIRSSTDLQYSAQLFPFYNEALITKALSNPESFKLFIVSNYDLRHTAKTSPSHAKQLIEHVLATEKAFKFFIDYDHDFRQTLGQFPEYADALMTKALAYNPDWLINVASGGLDLANFAARFPNHAEELISKVLSNILGFNRFIKNLNDLIQNKDRFPNHAEELITQLLSSPDQFTKIIPTLEDLNRLATHFPNHPEFVAPSLEAALEQIREQIIRSAYEHRNLEITAKRLAQLYHQDHLKGESGKQLPPETLIKIAEDTMANPTQGAAHSAFFKQYNEELTKEEAAKQAAEATANSSEPSGNDAVDTSDDIVDASNESMKKLK